MGHQAVNPVIPVQKRIARRVKNIGLERIRAVWDAPATFNRASRRAAGVFGRLWRWDPQALGIDPNLPPRYVRRHWAEATFTHPKTRRQRRHRARILKAMKGRLA